MKTNTQTRAPKILILATLSGGYRGADAAGQSQVEYAPDTYILPVMGKDDAYIAMFDLWRPKNAIDGRYLWLPMRLRDGRFELHNVSEWDLSIFD